MTENTPEPTFELEEFSKEKSVEIEVVKENPDSHEKVKSSENEDHEPTILTNISEEDNHFEKLVPRPVEVKKDSTLKYLSMLLFAILNLLYSLVEILFATKLFTGSLSLLGDGVHNFSDVLALAVAFWADKASKNKGNKTYTYGMVRGELIGGLINSVFLLSTAVFIILETSMFFSFTF